MRRDHLSVIVEWEREFREELQKRQNFMVSRVSLFVGRMGPIS